MSRDRLLHNLGANRVLRGDIPEPPELTEWAEKREAAAAEKERHDSALCATCGKRRDDEDHLYVASRNRVRCRFKETCPNADDPVLCKVHGGVFIPEAGCPVHDPEVRS